MLSSVVVVGASLAGLRAAEALRARGYDGRLRIVGDEPHPPYDRPPLSKQVLAGTWEPDRAFLIDADGSGEGDALGAEWELGRRATRLDLATRTVALDDGSTLGFDGLVIATGARPRTLAGTEGGAGVHTLRTLDDCLAIRAAFETTPRRVVVVGAGFIGAEVAATARSRGLDVTLVEALPVPLGRVLGDELGTACAELHRDHGVDLRLGVGVAAIEGDDRVEQVRLADGTVVEADVVVVGVGVRPVTGWLEGSGLTVDDGVVCDETCLAAPGVVAAGDVARWYHRDHGQHLRVEHWDNAVEMGAAAAARLLAGDDPGEPYRPVPWFWSDQYDRKIQLVGRCQPTDEVAVVEGSVAERRFVALYGRAGRVVAVLGMNRPGPLVRWRARLVEGVAWDDAVAGARQEAS